MSTRLVLEADDAGYARSFQVTYPGDADIWEIADLLHRGLVAIGYAPEVIAKVLTTADEFEGLA